MNNPGLISKLLEFYNFNEDKLYRLKKIISNKNINFELARNDKHEIYLKANLENEIENIFEFGEYLNKNGFYERNCKILREKDEFSESYRVIIDEDEISELEIIFKNL